MRTFFVFIFIVLVGDLLGQTKPQTKTDPKKIPCDTIVRYGNRKIPVTKLTKGATTVTFALQAKPDSMIRLEKKEIEKIIYKNGNVEVFNNEVVKVVAEGDWKAVLVTKSEADVQGLYNRGETTVRSSTSARTRKKAEESVTMKLQKFGAAKKATYVLIVDEEFEGAVSVGDIPTYIAKAVAYGPEPLETGTDVVDPKSKENKPKSGK